MTDISLVLTHKEKSPALPIFCFFLLLVSTVPGVLAEDVSALGRIEPDKGVYQLAGPSELAVVDQLMVREGERVKAGQVLARLDTFELRSAEVERAKIEIKYAKRRLGREANLRETSATSVARMEETERDVEVWKAELATASQRLERSLIKAPVDGKVLLIHARSGERIGNDGLLELGAVDAMYAVAEVYETDIRRVATGQRARISSPSLSQDLGGEVERLGYLIGKNDVLDLDPVARRDARVVEVFVRLDESERVADLTNLQVTVIIETSD
ncbi:MAG: efflux RND transporter periplasmic adaptor subunit [Pseudomonadota bacterium]